MQALLFLKTSIIKDVGIWRRIIFCSVCLAILRCAVVPAWALNPNLPPSGNFDLSHWKLDLPINADGVLSGSNDAETLSTALLTGGFTNAYFYTGTDGSMNFWAPVTGATTADSNYPRSELREVPNPTNGIEEWTGYGAHTLNVQDEVLQIPSSGEIIIGQIKTDGQYPVAKVEYNNGTVQGVVKTSASNQNSDDKIVIVSISLSNSITYQMQMVNGLVTITINGTSNSLNAFQADPNWAALTFNFKAGDYCQDNSGASNEGGRVAMYALSAYHAPSITNQPASTNVTAGQKTTFTVGANGNGNLGYQWQFNATNALAGATNAFLTITNAQSTNSGSYSVVVTDSLGSVTSAVAALTITPTGNSGPSITTPPAPQTVVAGQNAAFTVVAGGTAPLSYQWRFNSTNNVVWATNASLTITNAQSTNAGGYAVVVTNSYGSVTTAVATLTIVNPLLPETVTWSGAGTDYNWSTAGNWIGGTPAPLNDIRFFDPGMVGTVSNVNSIVDANNSINSLMYGNTNGFHTTQIPLGSTLSVSSTNLNQTILKVGTGTDNGNMQTTYATILGRGALLITNNSGVLSVAQGSAIKNGTQLATLDMASLAAFTAYVLQINLCKSDNANSSGTILFAQTNIIYCFSSVGSSTAGLYFGDSQYLGGTVVAQLGKTNAIFSDAGLRVGCRSYNGTLSFNPAFTNSTPMAFFRNLAGNGRQAAWSLGDLSAQASGGRLAAGTIDFSNGIVDAQVNTITLGLCAGGAAGNGTGTLTFNAGTIDVNTLNIGYQSVTNTASGQSVGTVNVNGSALLVVNTNILLAHVLNSIDSGMLNINGGTVRANSITYGGGTKAAISLTGGGTLVLTNTAGNVGSPILYFTMADSTLQLPVTAGVTNIVVATLDATGTTTNNTINLLSLPIITSLPTQFPLIGYGTYISATSSDFLLGSVPAGYQGYISNNLATSTIDVVLTAGRPPQARIAPVTVSGTNLVVSVPTVSGGHYVLQSATNLTPRINWVSESTNAGTGGTLILNMPITPNNRQKFLRFWVY